MTSLTEHGYLVLADISGYTAYLEKVELEHAHDILTELLGVIVEQFRPMLTISKLEGDAVFAQVSEAQLPRSEALLEIIENTYLTFRQHRDSSSRRTTCTCRACRAIPSLDLKFIIHQGDYIVQNISGIRELVGSDVNLVHRLMKNHVTEQTGWKAYLLFTQAALEKMVPLHEGLVEQVETYEHLGDTHIQVLNLWSRYETLRENRRVIITQQEADLELSCEFPVPVSLTWQMISDPQMLTQTMPEGGAWTVLSRPGGRSGVGARNHCAHGKGPGSEYLYLDWRPFHYYTAEASEGSMIHLEMFLVEPTPDGHGTRFTVRLKLITPLPRPLRKLMLIFMAKKSYLEFFESSRHYLITLDRSAQLDAAAQPT